MYLSTTKISANTYTRDWLRTEKDDFTLNIQPRLDQYSAATPVKDVNGRTIGWQIKSMYE